MDLDDSETRLALQVALKIGRVIGRRGLDGGPRTACIIPGRSPALGRCSSCRALNDDRPTRSAWPWRRQPPTGSGSSTSSSPTSWGWSRRSRSRFTSSTTRSTTGSGSTARRSRASPGSTRATCTSSPTSRRSLDPVGPGQQRRPPRCSATSTRRTASRSTATREPCSKRQLARAEELGYVFQTGPELEFFLLRTSGPQQVEPLPHDQAGYFDVTTDLAADVRKEMVERARRPGHRGRGEPPRGRGRPARDRLQVRPGPAHRRQRGHLPGDAEGDRPAARPLRDVHAQAVLRHQRLRHALPPEPGRRRRPARTCSTTRTTSTACRTWRSTSSPGSSRTRGACRRSWRRWSTRTSGWCRATRRRST